MDERTRLPALYPITLKKSSQAECSTIEPRCPNPPPSFSATAVATNLPSGPVNALLATSGIRSSRPLPSSKPPEPKPARKLASNRPKVSPSKQLFLPKPATPFPPASGSSIASWVQASPKAASISWLASLVSANPPSSPSSHYRFNLPCQGEVASRPEWFYTSVPRKIRLK